MSRLWKSTRAIDRRLTALIGGIVVLVIAFTWNHELFHWTKVNKDALAGLASVFTILGTVLAVLIFGSGLRQYAKAESWKRNEFIAKSFRDMIDDPACQRTMSMLDWDGREIDFGTKDQPASHYCNYKLVISALRTHDLSFIEVEMRIRDTFDRFFSFISLFESALKNRLIDERSVYAYFSYWIQLLRGERHLPQDLVSQIATYIDTYGFSDVRTFLDRPWPADMLPVGLDIKERTIVGEIHQTQKREP